MGYLQTARQISAEIQRRKQAETPGDANTPESLEGIDKQYFDDLLEVMVGPKFRMPEAVARRKALSIVRESAESIRARGIDAFGRKNGK